MDNNKIILSLLTELIEKVDKLDKKVTLLIDMNADELNWMYETEKEDDETEDDFINPFSDEKDEYNSCENCDDTDCPEHPDYKEKEDKEDFINILTSVLLDEFKKKYGEK